MKRQPPSSPHRLFAERLLIAIAAAAVLLILWRLSDLILLIFGSIVIAVVLRIAAAPIARISHLPERPSLAIAIMLISFLAAAMLFLFGAQANIQFVNLARDLPQGWRDLERIIASYPLGQEFLGAMRAGVPSENNILGRLGDLLLTIGNALADLILIVIGAVFLAAQPRLYRDGFLKLFPRDWRALVGETMDDGGRALRLWLRGQLVSMVIVGLLTWGGLVLVGVPSAFALGSVAALAEVVPYVGPIVSAVPGLLLALLVGPETALSALAVYIVVQQLEGNVIQPLVQRKVVTLPPAITLFGMVAGGLLFGFLGLVFAAPAAVVFYVFLKRVYIRELLHTPVSVPGEKVEARRS